MADAKRAVNGRVQEPPSKGGPVQIVVNQDMVGASVDDLESRFLAEMAKAKGQEVTLDLRNVRQIDARGVALFIGVYKECLANNCIFHAEVGSDFIHLLKLIKLTRIIDIREVAAV
jgi:anti-anti-sigma regulatory factor